MHVMHVTAMARHWLAVLALENSGFPNTVSTLLSQFLASFSGPDVFTSKIPGMSIKAAV